MGIVFPGYFGSRGSTGVHCGYDRFNGHDGAIDRGTSVIDSEVVVNVIRISTEVLLMAAAEAFVQYDAYRQAIVGHTCLRRMPHSLDLSKAS